MKNKLKSLQYLKLDIILKIFKLENFEFNLHVTTFPFYE